ncbi:MAG: class I SAM-dependent methyltransferase [Desulfuromonadaceae bacterium]|jgi:SAM-dependent methyltransferase|nr:class I SAM-dependent methyltransferase [Desulfuromonadaceae bacterium]
MAYIQTDTCAQTEDALEQTQDFWREFYARSFASGALRHTPSPFAQWCMQTQLLAKHTILELGCGNGRDSFAFVQHGHSVLAVDGCEVAITDNLAHYHAQDLNGSARFHTLDFAQLNDLPTLIGTSLAQVDILYTRFVLHAIPEVLEDALLDFAARTLPKGGRMLHEFRTNRDPLLQKGEVLSANERLTDHYRRFLDADTFRQKLGALGWKELFFIESQGLAVFGNDNPVVARVVVEKA